MTGASPAGTERLCGVAAWAFALVGLYLSSLYSYPLFHTIAELLCVSVAFAMFMLTWNSRRFFSNSYLIFISISFLFVGIIDLIHTLAYKGLNIFTGFDADLPTQLWIARGYLQGLSLVIAPLLFGRALSYPAAFAAQAGVSGILVGAIFLGYFPACFVEGSGLTSFKIASEYVISLLFLLSLYLLYRRRAMFGQEVFRLISGSILLSTASEFAFTFYVSVYGLSNLAGHFLKLLAYYLLYRAIIVTGLVNPYRLLFREIKESEDALQKERDFIDAVLETAGSLVVVVDREGRTVRFNKACRELTGYSVEDMRGRHFADCLLQPAEKDHVIKVFDGLLAGRFPVRHESYWVSKKGDARLIEWSNTAIMGRDGCVEYVIATGIDITEQRQAEEEVALLNEILRLRVAELATANSELESFTYSASHDLRSPLVAISGFSKALEEDYGDRIGESGRDYLRRINAASERMSALITDLLNLSRLSRVEMTRAAVDLSALAAGILDEFRRNEPGRKVECIVQQGLAAVGDGSLLRIAIENLLWNAWKFTAKTENARIEFGVMQIKPPLRPLLNQGGEPACPVGRAMPVYFVRDNGAGFDMAHAERLFAPFQRLHSAAQYPGSGIGLATVQRIISRHGGRIWAESEVDKGAGFYFTL